MNGLKMISVLMFRSTIHSLTVRDRQRSVLLALGDRSIQLWRRNKKLTIGVANCVKLEENRMKRMGVRTLLFCTCFALVAWLHAEAPWKPKIIKFNAPGAGTGAGQAREVYLVLFLSG